MAAAALVGCRTPIQEENFSNTFDAPKVTQLSHEAYQVAWDALFWARHDLRFAVRPTIVDYEAVAYLNEICRRVGWIARKVEKNPTNARVSSKRGYDNVAYDTMMLRLRYQPASFMPSTDAKIEHLLTLMDQIAMYYAQHANGSPTERGGR
jgi:hypothetical protein